MASVVFFRANSLKIVRIRIIFANGSLAEGREIIDVAAFTPKVRRSSSSSAGTLSRGVFVRADNPDGRGISVTVLAVATGA